MRYHNVKYFPLVVLTSGCIITSQANASDKTEIEAVGNVVSIAIPSIAYASTFYMDDKSGRQQFYQSFATNAITTYGLKHTINKERPDKSDNSSFPSGHTSVAFQGAGFIHKRYGLQYSIPAYAGAVFVGYSRIESDRHDVTDVLAGAVLGIASSMYLTKSYSDDLTVSTNLSTDYVGMTVNYQF